MTDETVVEADGVRVTKSFDPDGFPVPAVRFDVVSTRSDETELAITDEIPEEFEIDQIGFHPEYGSEHWTATGDGVVRFERPISPSEEFTTVYGVRMGDDEEPAAFLSAPTVIVGEEPVGPGIDDVVPRESSDIVRELAGGARDTIPGLDDSLAEDVADTDDANEPLLDALHQNDDEIDDTDAAEPSADATDAPTAADLDSDEPGEPADAPETAGGVDGPDMPLDDTASTTEDLAADGSEAEDSESAIEDVVADLDEPAQQNDAPVESSPDESSSDETLVDTDAIGDAEADDEPPEATPDDTIEAETDSTVAEVDTSTDLVSSLAEQVRNDEVGEDDLDVLRRAFGSTRTAVQLEHLQTRISEMEAYADALGAFIDENGDAKGLLEDLQADVRDVRETVDDLDSSVDDAATDRDDIRDSLSETQDELAAINDDLEAIDDLEGRLDRLNGDLDALDERVSDVEETATTVPEIQDEIQEIRDEMRELNAWRNQISDVFGG